MSKSLFVVGLLLFSCTLCLLVATKSTASEHRKVEDNWARERILRLKRLGEGYKLVTVELTRLQFVLGKPQLTNEVVSRSEDFMHLACDEQKRIAKRVSWLESLRDNRYGIEGTGSVSMQIPGEPKIVAFCEIYGVEAIQVGQKDGTNKYLAIRPTCGGFMGMFDSVEAKLPQRIYKDRTRKDFLNPEDIDWFFGVKDFSTYRHD